MIKKVTLFAVIMTGLMILCEIFNLLLNFSVIRIVDVPMALLHWTSVIYLVGYISIFLFFVVLYQNQKRS